MGTMEQDRRTPVGLFEDWPGVRLALQVLLGVFGFPVGFALLANGLWSGFGPFNGPDDSAFNLSTLAGLTMLIWTYLGIRKPTPLRYLPPAVGSIALVVWFFYGLYI